MFYIVLFLALLAIDQGTKLWAIERLMGQSPIHVIDNWLSFIYVENRGAAFGILQDKRTFFIFITVAVVLFLTGYFIKTYNHHSFWSKVSFVLIITGALGNLIDRIRFGYVVDFIAVKFGGALNFPVFNVADMCVVIGASLLMIMLLVSKEFS